MKHLLIFFCFTLSCTSPAKDDLSGLWQLDEIKVDEYKRLTEATFLKIYPNNTFAVSRTSGDFIGIYKLSAQKLKMKSVDRKWFNSTWTVQHAGNGLYFKGKDSSQKNTKLRFKKIEKIPDFGEFENRILGRWELYRIVHKKIRENLTDTWFTINEESYSIIDGEGNRENGEVIINSRHRKIIFKNSNSEWRVLLFGNELRLFNDKTGVQYRLRKNDWQRLRKIPTHLFQGSKQENWFKPA